MKRGKNNVVNKQKMKAIVVVLICFSSLCYAQENPVQEIPFPKNMVSVNVMGATPLVGITYQRNLYDRLALEAGVGYMFSYEIGTKFYLTKLMTNQFNGYLGLSYSHWEFLAPFNYVYASAGMHMSFKSGVVITIGLGGAYLDDIMFGHWYWQPWGNLSIGFPF